MSANIHSLKLLGVSLLMATTLSGCGTWDRLKNIGKHPELTPIENPVEVEGYQPVSLPMPQQMEETAGANSLWKPGASGFFKDQRAQKVGDIITVKVSAQDTAMIESEFEQNRDDNKDSVGVGSLLGYEGNFKDYLPDAVVPSNLIDITSNREMSGDGKVDRKDKIDMTMAAIVTQVLPNGNLVIEGTQEIRVNYELRQMTVRGVIRRADIQSDNTIESSKIAELRVTYGGKGVVSDVQQPRYGRKVIDVLMPF